MKIDQGLFNQDFADHHAVLGVAINSSAKDARKRYLKIARKLHPDSFTASSKLEKNQASELLSKLVNPAYEVLSQEKAASEHSLMLLMKGQQLSHSTEAPELSSEQAKVLWNSKNIEHDYRMAVKALADIQYDSLDQIAETTGCLSELNLVYIIRKPGKNPTQPATESEKLSPIVSGGPVSQRPRRTRETVIDSYLERARVFEREKDYSRSILELREALKTYPDSAACHAQLATVYLRSGQATMARVHVKRALAICPNDETALKLQKHLDRQQGAAQMETSQGAKSRGLFGLFGGKKK